jgi:hypothetical protein
MTRNLAIVQSGNAPRLGSPVIMRTVSTVQGEYRSNAREQGSWGRSPRAGGHGGSLPNCLPSFLRAEQAAKDAQPEVPS